jgi:glucose-6-phosphate 1-dehydrogenase
VIPEAYERLLLDALHGDASLFTRSDEIEEAWEIIDAIIAGLNRPETPSPYI